MTKEKDISVDYLRTRLRYEPETGKLFWLDNEDMPNNWRARFSGKEALNSTGDRGYKRGDILYRPFLAHRVAWALFYGEWPSDQIDHINGVRDDNRIANLRDVPHGENCKNKGRSSKNTSGVTGVHWDSQQEKWMARIRVNYKYNYLGRFDCIGQAIKARREAEALYGFHPNHGKR